MVFFKQKFSLKLFLRGWRLQFRQTCCNFFTRSSKRISEFTIFSIKNFFLKCSTRKAHCDFENLAERFLSEVEKDSRTYISFHPKFSAGKVECKIHLSPKYFLPKPEKNLWTYYFFQTKVFSLNNHLKKSNAALTNLPKFSHPKTERNYAFVCVF